MIVVGSARIYLAGRALYIVQNRPTNIKHTWPRDYEREERDFSLPFILYPVFRIPYTVSRISYPVFVLVAVLLRLSLTLFSFSSRLPKGYHAVCSWSFRLGTSAFPTCCCHFSISTVLHFSIPPFLNGICVLAV